MFPEALLLLVILVGFGVWFLAQFDSNRRRCCKSRSRSRSRNKKK